MSTLCPLRFELYGHLDTIVVKAGILVDKGEPIGTVGNTGRSTGPHTEFRLIRNGAWHDPQDAGFLETLHSMGTQEGIRPSKSASPG